MGTNAKAKWLISILVILILAVAAIILVKNFKSSADAIPPTRLLGTIKGKVYYAETKEPITSAKIVVTSQGSFYTKPQIIAYTGQDGNYAVGGLDPSLTYDVTAYVGNASSARHGVTVGSKHTVNIPTTPKTNHNVSVKPKHGVTISSAHNVKIAPSTGSSMAVPIQQNVVQIDFAFKTSTVSFGIVNGNVTWNDAKKTVIAGAQVELSYIPTKSAVIKGVTNSNGSFHFTNLKPGAYTLKVTVSGSKEKSISRNINVTNEKAVNSNFVFNGQVVNLFGTYKGVVTNASTKQPISGVTLTYTNNTKKDYNATTNSKGEYQISLPAGTYNLRVQKVSSNGQLDGFWPVNTVNLVVQAGQTVNQNHALRPIATVGSISGRVFLKVNGTARPNATVKITASSGKVTTIKTDKNGNYLVNDLAPGTYKVEATDRIFTWTTLFTPSLTGSTSVTVKAGEQALGNINLS